MCFKTGQFYLLPTVFNSSGSVFQIIINAIEDIVNVPVMLFTGNPIQQKPVDI